MLDSVERMSQCAAAYLDELKNLVQVIADVQLNDGNDDAELLE